MQIPSASSWPLFYGEKAKSFIADKVSNIAHNNTTVP
jgi:hypothetical protein